MVTMSQKQIMLSSQFDSLSKLESLFPLHPLLRSLSLRLAPRLPSPLRFQLMSNSQLLQSVVSSTSSVSAMLVKNQKLYLSLLKRTFSGLIILSSNNVLVYTTKSKVYLVTLQMDSHMSRTECASSFDSLELLQIQDNLELKVAQHPSSPVKTWYFPKKPYFLTEPTSSTIQFHGRC